MRPEMLIDKAVCLVIYILITKKKWIVAALLAITTPWIMASLMTVESAAGLGVGVVTIVSVLILFSRQR
jgi:ABC-type transport system involved in cytochrome bd biosynthesis fused ATPase/permease subunit